MIIAKDIASVWKKHRLELLAIHQSETVRKIGARDLEHRYTDLNGVNYSGFTSDMSLPVDRLGRLYSFMEILMKGMTVAEDEAIDKAITDALESGLKNPKEKAAAKIGALIMEREKRRKMVIHTEILYNLLAVQWIREDEDPATFNNEIHMQKVIQFQKEVGEGSSYPFFQVPELKQLNSFLKMSKEEWDAFWNESLIQQKVLTEALKTIYSSEQGSKKFVTTSTLA